MREATRPQERAGWNKLYGLLTANEYVRVPVQPLLSFALIVTLHVPQLLGLPEMTPAELRVNPLGKLPFDTENVYGLFPPLAVTVWL
jgi:hypothetical protein